MTFSPLAHRELLAAARNRRTFLIRLGIAAFAVLLTWVTFMIISLTGAGRSGAFTLFRLLAWCSFVFSIGSGIWLTADAIGQERREGTLGLLFLTDLKGYDIIFAKLLTHGLTAVGAVVAVFPVMTIAWLFGGLTGPDMARTFLAILNTLFVSLAIGLAMSAYPQRAGESLLLTALWLGCSLLVLPLLHWALAKYGVGTAARAWLDANLLTGFRAGAGLLMPNGIADPTRFWRAFWTTHLIGWGSLGFAAWAVRRWAHSLEVRQPASDPEGVVAAHRRPASGFRRDLLDINPILGLIGTPLPLRLVLWALVTVQGIAGFAAWTIGLPPMVFYNLLFGGWLGSQPTLHLALAATGLGIRAVFAWHATEFYAEGRRSELLQTVCTTPIRDETILRGSWLALTRTFCWPLIVAVSFSAVLVGLYCWRPTGLIAAAAAPAGAGTTPRAVVVAAYFYTWLALVADLAAMVWAGAFSALALTRRQVAFGVTFFLGGLLPQLGFCIPSSLISLGVFLAARSQFRFGIRRLFAGERQPGERSWQPMLDD